MLLSHALRRGASNTDFGLRVSDPVRAAGRGPRQNLAADLEHKHVSEFRDRGLHFRLTLLSTLSTGLLPIYNAPMSCSTGISSGKLKGAIIATGP